MGRLRIVSGSLRGRWIRFPDTLPVRPTLGKVREAIFDMLGELSGTRVCDLYAGTGALGFEALSRGAEHVVMIESHKRAVHSLMENARLLGVADRLSVVCADVARSTRRIAGHGPFDLVLADPPYRTDAVDVIMSLAAVPGVVGPRGLVVIETHVSEVPAEDPIRGDGFTTIKRKRYGSTAVTIMMEGSDAKAAGRHLPGDV